MNTSKNRVLLIHAAPKSDMQPLSVLCVAEALIKNGIGVQIIDTAVDNLYTEIKKVNFNNIVCVGISSWTGPQIAIGLKAASLIRKIDRKLPIIWGGIHASLVPEQTAKSEYVDIVVRGEAEATIVELVRVILNKEDYSGIKGITYCQDGRCISNPNREFIDLNGQDYLPYDLLSVDKYNFRDRFVYNSSRGCPFECAFCYNLAFNRGRWRAKSADKVLDDLEYYVRKLKPKQIVFVEDDFFLSQQRVEEICRGIINKKLNIEWVANARANYLAEYDDTFFELLRESGCQLIEFGAESGSLKILGLIDKRITPEIIRKAARRCQNNGIAVNAHFICGFPFEKEEDSKQTVDLIEELWQMGIGVGGYYMYYALPGTSLFNIAKNNGLISPESLEQWSDWRASQNAQTPWLNRSRRMRLWACSEIVRYIHFRNMCKLLVNKKALPASYRLSAPIFLFVDFLFYPLFMLRWRKKFFSFPLDLKLWNLAKMKVRKMY